MSRYAITDAATLACVAAKSLSAAGSDVLYGIPGGGNNLELVGAAEAEGMQFVLTHTETAAAYMAGVHAELSGTPTGCLATRGPGAANSVNGVAQAWLDRQPVVMITDTVATADASRVAHQRLDQRALFRPLTKATAVLGAGGEKLVTSALDLAAAPRPGPVHLDFDPSTESSHLEDRLTALEWNIDEVRRLLTRARRPAILLGMGARGHAATIRALVRHTNVPVLETYKARGIVPTSWPNSAGVLTGAAAETPVLESADLLVALGLDTVELIPGTWPYTAPVVSLSEWPDDASYVEPEVEVVGPLSEMVEGLGALPDDWEPGWAARHRHSGVDALLDAPEPTMGLAPCDVVSRTRRLAPAGSIATVDSGAHMLPAMSLWDVEDPGEVLISSGLATMGFALPAAIAAALARPTHRVICFVGDGGLGMVLAELETLARLRLPVTVVVFNDSLLSLIRIKQMPEGHGGHNAVTFGATDYDAIAAAVGMDAARIHTPQELDAAVSQSLASPDPMLLDVAVDPGDYSRIMHVIRG